MYDMAFETMSSNMATSAKPLRVTTSYKRNELKLVKVAIRRHKIKAVANSQPLERIVENPFAITTLVNISDGSFGVKLFNKITPNTIEIPAEAYCKIKSTPTVRGTASPSEQEPSTSSPRSASCSSDKEHQQEDRCRSRSREKFKANETAQAAKQVPSTERNTHPPYEMADRYNKRKSRRSGTRSPSLRRSRYSYSPSRRHSPENGRYRSTSNSPQHRSQSRSNERLKTNDFLSAKQKRRTPDRDRERSRSPVPRTERYDRRKSGWADSPEFFDRGPGAPYFDPALIRAPISFYPAMPPYYPPGMPPAYFNQPFFPAQHPGAFGPGTYHPRKRGAVYMNRKIQIITNSTGNTGTSKNTFMSEGEATRTSKVVISEITAGVLLLNPTS
ncbi:uncharacterized protein [Atheta coriaria]|uniref:uncharacterized protein isoform X2 n=1 Tax=Dalotia coriaria TaxID=877792 RepID=UPI0031F34B1D